MIVTLFVVLVVGLLMGAIVNWAAYGLAWNRRAISPWSCPPEHALPRQWTDRIPVVGWLGLRREEPLHGGRFWVRPMLVELGLGLGLPLLYWWEVSQYALIEPQVRALLAWYWHQPIPPFRLDCSEWALLSGFLGHAILLLFMVAATLIDIDEKIIPDEVTVPGTLVGLFLAVLLPMPLLPHVAIATPPPHPSEKITIDPARLQPIGEERLRLTPVSLSDPGAWPLLLQGGLRPQGLLLGLACYGLWCFALVPRIWHGGRGYCRGLGLIATRVIRELRRPPLVWITLAGALFITSVWFVGGSAWKGLLSSLVGLVISGGVVWAVRIIGSAALRREAMGFGDVTLMMMIGAYLGWQAGLIIFFLSPFAGLIVGVLQLVLHRDDVIPYGPFLCLGTLIVMVRWGSIWDPLSIQPLFHEGWLVPLAMMAGLVLLGLMLAVWRFIKMSLFGR
jgi:leader peptidase (prepilin peptidase) / N-methyltransferase